MISSKKKNSGEEKLRRTWLQDFLMKNKTVKSENQIVRLKDLLNQIRSDDPKYKVFIKKQISGYYKTEKQNELDREMIRRLKIQNRKLLERLHILKDQIRVSKAAGKEMREQLASLLKLNHSLAGALGTCPLCWGNDPDCKNCAGNGSPGWVSPSRKLFNMYVLPVLQHSLGKLKDPAERKSLPG